MFSVLMVSLWTIVRKELRRFLRLWVQTLVPPVITIVLYFAIFGNLIGKRIGEMSGFNYMEFIVPGLVMMAVINSSYGNVVSSFFHTKFQHCIEELLIAPVASTVILSGYLIGGIIRGLLVGLIVFFCAQFFTSVTVTYIGLTILTAFLTALIFALAGFITALFAHSFDEISIIPTFVLTPLIYLGGVFYSIQLLPPFWRTVSLFNPILYLVNIFRYSILGSSDMPVVWSLSFIALFVIILYAFALWLLKKGIGIRS